VIDFTGRSSKKGILSDIINMWGKFTDWLFKKKQFGLSFALLYAQWNVIFEAGFLCVHFIQFSFQHTPSLTHSTELEIGFPLKWLCQGQSEDPSPFHIVLQVSQEVEVEVAINTISFWLERQAKSIITNALNAGRGSFFANYFAAARSLKLSEVPEFEPWPSDPQPGHEKRLFSSERYYLASKIYKLKIKIGNFLDFEVKFLLCLYFCEIFSYTV